MQPSAELCYRALRSRDRRFEGHFIVGVRTTGIYCRPGCPARLPKPENVVFFACVAAAEESGLRPCLRCRPDRGPGTPAWLGTSVTVARSLRLICAGALDGKSVEQLASRLGVGARHLRRLFAEHLGTSPLAVAQTRRIHFARKLIDETVLPMSEVASCAGFSSVRRFNDAIRATFRRPPGELRRTTRPNAEQCLTLRLPFRAPFDWPALLSFVAPRVTAGVEQVRDNVYARTVVSDGAPGVVEVSWKDISQPTLQLRVRLPPTGLLDAAERASRMFDLDADPVEIAQCLGRDHLLAALVKRRPGLRVPGAWDGFELAVRAILGQQISVARATILAGKLVATFGVAFSSGVAGLTHLFPTPQRLANADVSVIGLPRTRGRAIESLARAVCDGSIRFDGALGLDEAMAQLEKLPGIGPWTASYIAMRAMREPDAFPVSDLGLRRAYARLRGSDETEQLPERAEAWRPWRAYAAMHLWMSDRTIAKEIE